MGSHHHHHHQHGGQSHGHHHGHAHHHGQAEQRIGVAIFLNLGFAIAELIGGIWANSIAIQSNALHDFGDSISLIFAWVLERFAKGQSNHSFSYGMRRLSLLSALLTGVVLVVGSALVLTQAIPRLLDLQTPRANEMIVFAFFGVAVNAFAAYRMMRSGATMNERMLTWHLIEDVLGWVCVLIGALIMRFADLPILDPVLAILFTSYILWGVVRNLGQTVRLFLQGTPDNFDLMELVSEIERLPGVRATHDTHLWSLDGASHVLTVHAVVSEDMPLSKAEGIRNRIKQLVQSKGNIHATVELESDPACCGQVDCAKTGRL